MLAVVAATAAVAATILLPWATSGERTRNAVELIDLTQRLGLADAAWERSLLWASALLPAQVGGVLVAASLHRRRLAGVLCATAGVVAIAGSIVVWRTPLLTELGPVAATVLGTIAVVVGLSVAAASWPDEPDTEPGRPVV